LGVFDEYSPQSISNLLRSIDRDLKIVTDQGIAVAHYTCGICLQKDEDVSTDFQ
jgi:hypothetical protein